MMEDGVYQVNAAKQAHKHDMTFDQVDACPRAFAVILNWLRYRQLMLGGIGAEEVSHALLGRLILSSRFPLCALYSLGGSSCRLFSPHRLERGA